MAKKLTNDNINLQSGVNNTYLDGDGNKRNTIGESVPIFFEVPLFPENISTGPLIPSGKPSELGENGLVTPAVPVKPKIGRPLKFPRVEKGEKGEKGETIGKKNIDKKHKGKNDDNLVERSTILNVGDHITIPMHGYLNDNPSITHNTQLNTGSDVVFEGNNHEFDQNYSHEHSEEKDFFFTISK